MKKIKLPKARSKEKKEKKEKKVIWKTVLSIILTIAIGIISIGLLFILYIVITSPNFEKQELYQKEPTILYDVKGDEMARVGSSNATVITFDELPDVLVDALIATEDSRFFQHNGLDLFRFLKATFGQVLHISGAGGASTLSMQVIKNTYNGGPEAESHGIKGIVRKFTDIYMAVFKLEANYTKEEIIEFYLNSQWFANDGNINYDSITGIEQASQYYFGKSSKDLNLAEASLLAGMFQNPAKYKPYKNPVGCRNRQKTVLKLMVRHGYITEDQMNDVLAIPIESMLVDREKVTEIVVESKQAFIDFVLNEVEEDLKLDPSRGSLKIYTTFDPKVQDVLEQVENGDIYEFPSEVVEEGIAVTSTVDGSVVALSGGRNYKAKGTNFSLTKQQPGSTAKPIIDYAMYIEHITQSTYAMLLDERTTYTTGKNLTNHDNSYDGLVTMRWALKDSRNVPALRVFREVSALDQNLIIDYAHSVGIDFGETLFESASIGGFDGVSPLAMSAAYAVFGRGGYYIEPYAYTKVIDAENVTHNNSYTREKVLEETTAYIMNVLLMNAYTGSGPGGSTQVAGKTGTTNLDGDTKKKYGLSNGAINDAWIVSYSASHSIALWYGFEDLAKQAMDYKESGFSLTSSTGGTARRRIMNGLSSKIHVKNSTFTVPKNITAVNIESETFPAQLCSEYTPQNNNMCTTEYFVKGTEPTEVSKRYSQLDNPTNGSYNFSNNTITLNWTGIKTPEAIDPNYLLEHFKKYYAEYYEKYYEKRIDYNNSNIGSLGYRIYLKDETGKETEIGYTNSTTFNYNVSTGGNYTFIVKSSYSIFKSNMSSGLTINTKTIDSNVEDLVTPTNPDDTTPPTDDTPTEENNN